MSDWSHVLSSGVVGPGMLSREILPIAMELREQLMFRLGQSPHLARTFRLEVRRDERSPHHEFRVIWLLHDGQEYASEWALSQLDVVSLPGDRERRSLGTWMAEEMLRSFLAVRLAGFERSFGNTGPAFPVALPRPPAPPEPPPPPRQEPQHVRAINLRGVS